MSTATRTRLPAPQPRVNETKHMNIVEICAELGVARRTFYDWRAKGRAPKCIKLPNGDLRVHRDEFDRWLESLEDEGAS